MTRVVAVDLGAGSARVAVIDLGARPPTLEIVHRYAHVPARADDGSLRWDWERLVAEVERGLARALERGPIASIGIDTWGVDYGLVDRQGALVAPPYSYRDERTDGWEEVAEQLGRQRLYRTSGIQLMGINTVFQLAAHAKGARHELARASTLLLLPELLICALTGTRLGERTSAGTTALVDVATGDWAKDLVDEIGIDPALLPPIERAGTQAGSWRGIPVHLVGGHDTASAVAAVPGDAAEGAAFISSGTWMLVGAERPMADLSERARVANFSNEPAVYGGVRFLKNVMGLWMLEQCRAQWRMDLRTVLDAAEAVGGGGPVVDATDERFLAPADMEAEVRAAAALPDGAGRDQVARCVLDSLAHAAATVISELGSFLDRPVPEVCVIGGGARNGLLNRLMAEASGVPVRPGPTEATAFGNALAQGITLGVFDDLAAARLAMVGAT